MIPFSFPGPKLLLRKPSLMGMASSKPLQITRMGLVKKQAAQQRQPMGRQHTTQRRGQALSLPLLLLKPHWTLQPSIYKSPNLPATRTPTRKKTPTRNLSLPRLRPGRRPRPAICGVFPRRRASTCPRSTATLSSAPWCGGSSTTAPSTTWRRRSGC